MRGNLPPPRASHILGLRQSQRVNYTHATVNHVKNNSKTQTKSNHTNTNNKRQLTTKSKYTYLGSYDIQINAKNQTTSSKNKTNKHKSRKQENSYYNHNSNHDKKVKTFFNAIASFNKEVNEITYFINYVVRTQYGIWKGLQVFGDRGLAAIKKEMQQFYDLNVIAPISIKDMTKQQKSWALSYLIFLRERRDDKIKGRGCANGRKQRLLIQKEQTSFPTVSNQALFLSFVIDAKEKRDVGTADVPGAFLQPKSEGEVII